MDHHFVQWTPVGERERVSRRTSGRNEYLLVTLAIFLKKCWAKKDENFICWAKGENEPQNMSNVVMERVRLVSVVEVTLVRQNFLSLSWFAQSPCLEGVWAH